MATLRIRSNMNGKAVIKHKQEEHLYGFPRILTLSRGRYVIKILPIITQKGVVYSPDKKKIILWLNTNSRREIRIRYRRQAIIEDPLPDNEFIKELHTAINKVRVAGHGIYGPVDPVVYNAQLAKAAQVHAQDMADGKFFSHYGSDGSSFEERVNRTEYTGDPGGENIASGQLVPGEVVIGWLNSPAHLKNLMSAEYQNVGYGHAFNEVSYTVQNFGYDPAYY